MTTTTGVSGNTQLDTAIQSSLGTNEVTFDTFLKLLVTQLKNQDPLNPLEGTEFTGQIAQFSSLEQQINTNTYLKDLVEQRDYAQQTVAAGYIGKEILGAGDEFTKGADGEVSFGYSLEKTAANVEISIVNTETGKVVETINADPTAGSHMLSWDGKDDDGNAQPAGTYRVLVKAQDKDGNVVASSALTYGTVTSALNDQGSASVLLADGRQIALSDVLAVRNTAAAD